MLLRSYSEISGGGRPLPESVRGCNGPAAPLYPPLFINYLKSVPFGAKFFFIYKESPFVPSFLLLEVSYKLSFKDDGLSAEKFIKSPVQPALTINKKAVFMTEKKAQKIILSYVICQDNEGLLTLNNF